MTPLEILTDARKLIKVETNWTKGASFIDDQGHEMNVFEEIDDENTCQFCASGAVQFVGKSTLVDPSITNALNNACKQLFPGRLEYLDNAIYVDFNDHHDTTHKDVLKVFDLAISTLALQQETG